MEEEREEEGNEEIEGERSLTDDLIDNDQVEEEIESHGIFMVEEEK